MSQPEIVTLLHFAVIQNFEIGNFYLSHLISFALEYLVNSGIKRVEDVSPLLSSRFNQIKVRLAQMNANGTRLVMEDSRKMHFGFVCLNCGKPMVLGVRKECMECRYEFDLCFQKKKIMPKLPSNQCPRCLMVSYNRSVGKKCPYCKC